MQQLVAGSLLLGVSQQEVDFSLFDVSQQEADSCLFDVSQQEVVAASLLGVSQHELAAVSVLVFVLQHDAPATFSKGLMYLSKPSFSKTKPAVTDTPIEIVKYKMATLKPKVSTKREITMGLSSGLENKNTIIGPKPAFARNKPFKNGMVEQEQNGVIAPNKAAMI